MRTKLLMLMLVLLGVMVNREAQAFYNPSPGRWLSRDPISEKGGVNLYGFVQNAPTFRHDLLGLQTTPENPGSPPQTKGPCEQFDEWYQNEKKDISWMKELPNCPCKIKVSAHCTFPMRAETFAHWVETLDEVSSDKDAGWDLDSALIVAATRKGVAAHCIRSKATKVGARQECCYDSNGDLITGGAGAGTTDRGSGLGHKKADWDPYKLAVQCDKAQGGNSCVLKYLELRPVNNGNNCKKNEPK